MTFRSSHDNIIRDEILVRALSEAPVPKVPDGLTERIVAQAVRHEQEQPETRSAPSQNGGRANKGRRYLTRYAAALCAIIVLGAGSIAVTHYSFKERVPGAAKIFADAAILKKKGSSSLEVPAAQFVEDPKSHNQPAIADSKPTTPAADLASAARAVRSATTDPPATDPANAPTQNQRDELRPDKPGTDAPSLLAKEDITNDFTVDAPLTNLPAAQSANADVSTGYPKQGPHDYSTPTPNALGIVGGPVVVPQTSGGMPNSHPGRGAPPPGR